MRMVKSNHESSVEKENSCSPPSTTGMTRLLILGAILRFTLLLYGSYHDSTHTLKYTDVDYNVFTDAASFIYPHPSHISPGPLARYLAEKCGIYIGTPYDRLTYRYTPLLALFMILNAWSPIFGKFLFSAADLGIAWLQYRSLMSWAYKRSSRTSALQRDARSPSSTASFRTSNDISADMQAQILVSAIWLFNPIVANISTRGSAESLLGLVVLIFVSLLQQGRLDAAAVAFGLAVHFKLYPVIYAPTVLAYLAVPSQWLSLKQVRFGLISFSSFMLLNVAMYSIWGMPFVEHTYLYHLTRLDHRHNFSHYFYEIYLKIGETSSATSSHGHTNLSSGLQLGDSLIVPAIKLAKSTFVPQLALSLGIGWFLTRSKHSIVITRRLHGTKRDSAVTAKGGTAGLQQHVNSNGNLAAILFIQTLVFTTFNRVCTSQYFMWYIWFLPLALPAFRLSWTKGLMMLAAWIGGQAIWLSIAYRLEFLGEALFAQLWMAGGLFFCINISIVYVLLGRLRIE